jgi:hypothetical protein
MAISKKTKISKKKEVNATDKPIVYLPCEWVVQFDDDEPQLFATADESSLIPEVVIKLQNTSESHITFTDSKNGKRFKMYARPKLM